MNVFCTHEQVGKPLPPCCFGFRHVAANASAPAPVDRICSTSTLELQDGLIERFNNRPPHAATAAGVVVTVVSPHASLPHPAICILAPPSMSPKIFGCRFVRIFLNRH